MEEDAGSVEEEPDYAQVNDDGDVDGLAEASLGALIVERVEQMDELMFFEFAKAASAHLDGLGGRCGVGRGLEGGHGLLGSDGYGVLKFRCQVDRELREDVPPCTAHAIFSFLDADWAKEVVESKFLKLWGKPVDWKGETEFFFEY